MTEESEMECDAEARAGPVLFDGEKKGKKKERRDVSEEVR